MSKAKTAEIVQSLSERGYIIVKEQTIFRKRKANRYDLQPIVKILDKKEKDKYAELLGEHSKTRKKTSLRKLTKKPTLLKQSPELTTNIPNQSDEDHSYNIKIRIAELQKQYIGKHSDQAEEIRVLEKELSDITEKSKTTFSIQELMASRFKISQK